MVDQLADFLGAHGSEILSAVLGMLGGALISIPITVKVTRNAMSGKSTQSNQRGARAGGDMVGRDKISN
jgi:hypothetical protein